MNVLLTLNNFPPEKRNCGNCTRLTMSKAEKFINFAPENHVVFSRVDEWRGVN